MQSPGQSNSEAREEQIHCRNQAGAAQMKLYRLWRPYIRRDLVQTWRLDVCPTVRGNDVSVVLNATSGRVSVVTAENALLLPKAPGCFPGGTGLSPDFSSLLSLSCQAWNLGRGVCKNSIFSPVLDLVLFFSQRFCTFSSFI